MSRPYPSYKEKHWCIYSLKSKYHDVGDSLVYKTDDAVDMRWEIEIIVGKSGGFLGIGDPQNLARVIFVVCNTAITHSSL